MHSFVPQNLIDQLEPMIAQVLKHRMNHDESITPLRKQADQMHGLFNDLCQQLIAQELPEFANQKPYCHDTLLDFVASMVSELYILKAMHAKALWQPSLDLFSLQVSWPLVCQKAQFPSMPSYRMSASMWAHLLSYFWHYKIPATGPCLLSMTHIDSMLCALHSLCVNFLILHDDLHGAVWQRMHKITHQLALKNPQT